MRCGVVWSLRTTEGWERKKGREGISVLVGVLMFVYMSMGWGGDEGGGQGGGVV